MISTNDHLVHRITNIDIGRQKIYHHLVHMILDDGQYIHLFLVILDDGQYIYFRYYVYIHLVHMIADSLMSSDQIRAHQSPTVRKF